jgi:hypothetical protein
MLFFQSGIVVLNRSSPSSNTIIMFSAAAFANAVHPAAAAFHPDACFTFTVIKF